MYFLKLMLATKKKVIKVKIEKQKHMPKISCFLNDPFKMYNHQLLEIQN